MSCDCQTCKDIQRMRAVTSQLNELDTEFLHGLMARLMQTEMDLNWHQAIADGSWPNSVEILRGWLRNAQPKVEIE